MSTNTKSQKGITIAKANYKDENAVDIITKGVLDSIKSTSKKYDNIIIFNIGTDRCTGDSLAPMLGTFLTERDILNDKIKIMGTLDDPIHALNVVDTYSKLDIEKSFIIAIDASLGEQDSDIGNIYVKNTGIKAGSGIGKKLGEQGDISIQGVVTEESSISNFIMLQNVRLSLINNMTKVLKQVVVRVSEYIDSQDKKDTYDKTNTNCKVVQMFG